MEKQIIKAKLIQNTIITESNSQVIELNKKSYGVLLDNTKLQLSFVEALYLLYKKKIEVYLTRKKLDFDSLLKRLQKQDKNLWPRFLVYKDLRDKGYIVKTALKFGADFRVYDKGIKPGQDHAKWIVYPVHESKTTTWYEFAAKNRVAHSTRKKLLIAIIDDENDITYYEVKWVKI